MKSKIIILYTSLCFIWGTTWVVLKKSLIEGTPAIYGAGLRFFIAGLVLLLIVFIQKRTIPRTRIAVNNYILFGFFNLVAGYGLTYWAAQFIYSNVASIIWAGFPIVVVLLSHFTLPEERLNLKKIITIIMGSLGVILILSQGKNMGGENVMLGITVIVVAVGMAAYPNIYLKKHHEKIDTLSMNAVCQTGAGLVLLLISTVVDPDQIMVWNSFNIIALAYLTVFGTIFTWFIYIWLFKHLSMVQISYIAFPPPVIAAVLGWMILGESLTPLAILGAVMVIGGAVLVNMKR